MSSVATLSRMSGSATFSGSQPTRWSTHCAPRMWRPFISRWTCREQTASVRVSRVGPSSRSWRESSQCPFAIAGQTIFAMTHGTARLTRMQPSSKSFTVVSGNAESQSASQLESNLSLSTSIAAASASVIAERVDVRGRLMRHD